MRLINVKTMQLEAFASHTQQRYTILSHRWQEEEVLFEKWSDPESKSKQGYRKLKAFCNLVLERHEEGDFSPYAWVDTCCIDKRSSAELSEAINSMYEWYRDADLCCVFLSDVETAHEVSNSIWFTRCWTLQELIAPETLFFYNKDWKPLGSRINLQDAILKATRLERDILHGKLVSEYSVAQRMSWAAHRFATRVEDRAYSLMGLFEINMPMLYGEGNRAFIRLQEEIIRRSDDHSIFSWRMEDCSMDDHASCGLLSRDLSGYKNCSGITKSAPVIESQGYSMTNVGLSIVLATIPWEMNTYCALLDCTAAENNDGSEARVGIFLRRLSQKGQYARVLCEGRSWTLVKILDQEYQCLKTEEGMFSGRPILVRQDARGKIPSEYYGFHLDIERFPFDDVTLKRGSRGKETIHSRFNFFNELRPEQFGTVFWLNLEYQHTILARVVLGFDVDFNPVVYIRVCNSNVEAPLMDEFFDNKWINQASTEMDDGFEDNLQLDAVPSDVIRVFRVLRGRSLSINLPQTSMKAHLYQRSNTMLNPVAYTWTLGVESSQPKVGDTSTRVGMFSSKEGEVYTGPFELEDTSIYRDTT